MPASGTLTPPSLSASDVTQVIDQARADALASPPATVMANQVAVRTPHPSPEDWRDHWIYFLLVDRFNHPVNDPAHADPWLPYQGGTFEGIRQQLRYLKKLGVGAIWLSPVLMNPQHFTDYYGGYATQDFLRIEPRFCKDPEAARRTPELADQEFRDLVDAIHAEGMYVILDIVLNHAGDLFNYEGMRDAAPWKGEGGEYAIYWRDPENVAQGLWTDIAGVPALARDAGVWPKELQRNDYFRRRGDVSGSPDPLRGDFYRLKELVTEYVGPRGTHPVRDILIRAYEYLIARFDLDGFRVDTLMYVERDFARAFANAMREFALSIGKRNFFTFGEVWKEDDEAKIAEYVGRDTRRDDAIVGFDAALDFPMRHHLEQVCKGVAPPVVMAEHLDERLRAQRMLLSSHGDVGAYFVTFLDNHDLSWRYGTQCRPAQVTMALTCLMTLQGIPCIYYGTEQGLAGSGTTRESVRECLWRDRGVFTRSPQHPYYETIARLSALRDEQPALRYGRQYMRPLTGDGVHFGHSPYPGGVLAFSRVLSDSEVLVVANTSQTETVPVKVLVDRSLNPPGHTMRVLFSNLPAAGLTPPCPAQEMSDRAVVPVTLRPMEVQVLG